MLHDGDGHLVARGEHTRGERAGDDVQRLARVAGEHHLFGPIAANELGNLSANLCDGLGCLNREGIKAAQGVCVHGLVGSASVHRCTQAGRCAVAALSKKAMSGCSWKSGKVAL